VAGFRRSDLINGTGRVPTPVSTPIVKAETTQNNPAPLPTSLSDSPLYTPHVRGATFSVLDKLENISFVDGTSGGMSATPAYIQFWTRGGTGQKTQVPSSPTNQVAPSSSPQEVMFNELSFKGVDFYTSGTKTGLSVSFNPEVSIPFNPELNYTPSVKLVPPPPPGTTTVPTNTYKTKPPLVAEKPISGSKKNIFQKLLGGVVFSANPSGMVESATAAAPVPEGVWQFLFNPEELQMEYGPEFNRAESWGVSDPKNSGQPLSWRSNKNKKLIFSKVLLHGYTFGKRVEKLEKGLEDLFMTRSGVGSDGPPVLEFVWGKRVFGPCVIQNIRVKEESWDNGVLVNAEVSFELEKVPEWTINDGFVDITRPGRQPVINDPLLPARTSSPEVEDNKETAPVGENRPRRQNEDPSLCNSAVKLSEGFQEVFDKLDKIEMESRVFFSVLGINQTSKRNQEKSSDLANTYLNINDKFLYLKSKLYTDSKEIGEYVDKRLNNNGCTREKLKSSMSDIWESSRVSFPQSHDFFSLYTLEKHIIRGKWVRGCIKETKKYIDEWQRTTPKCKRQRIQGQLERKCKEYEQGKSCDNNLSTYSGCSSPKLNGYKVKCRNKKWVKITQ
jgi:hypothetical protein